MNTEELVHLRWLLEKAIAELADPVSADAEVRDHMQAVLDAVEYRIGHNWEAV